MHTFEGRQRTCSDLSLYEARNSSIWVVLHFPMEPITEQVYVPNCCMWPGRIYRNSHIDGTDELRTTNYAIARYCSLTDDNALCKGKVS